MTSFIAIWYPLVCPPRFDVVPIDQATAPPPRARAGHRRRQCVGWPLRRSTSDPERLSPLETREHAGQDHDQGALAGGCGPSRRSARGRLRQLLRSPSNGVNQKLAFSSADDLSAGLEIPVRIGKLTLQLGDAIGPAGTHPVPRDRGHTQHGPQCQPPRQAGDLHQPRRNTNDCD